jgi:transglutaminase-like putative cysteine protease
MGIPKAMTMFSTSERASDIKLRVGCEFEYQPVLETAAVFVVRPVAHGSHAMFAETWETSPSVPWHDYVDGYGNVCRRLTMPAAPFSARYEALVSTSPDLDPFEPYAPARRIEDLPDEALVYTLPSRFCLSDILFARAQELFGQTQPGWPCVQAICDWVHNNIRFAYGSSVATTTAADVLENGVGVCRDFAHLAITFCRAMNVPARYAFGYLPDIDVPPPYPTMDFCAWFEAYLGDRWYTFDPRNNERRKGRVLIGRGRDALDVAMVTSFGDPVFKSMVVHAERRF